MATRPSESTSVPGRYFLPFSRAVSPEILEFGERVISECECMRRSARFMIADNSVLTAALAAVQASLDIEMIKLTATMTGGAFGAHANGA